MSKLTQRLTLNLLAVAALSLSGFVMHMSAQTPAASPAPIQDEDAKNAAYAKFIDLRKTDQVAAYALAREYVQKWGTAEDDQTKFVKGWVPKYEHAKDKRDFQDAVTATNSAEAFRLGKVILAYSADDLNVLMGLGFTGYKSAVKKDKTFSAESTNYAKSALRLIETAPAPVAGAKPIDWSPFANKDEAIAWLTYGIGFMNVDGTSPDAKNYLYKAAQLDTFKKVPSIYFYLAQAYLTSDWKPASDQYNAIKKETVTPEGEAALNHLYQITERLMDFYGRTIAYAGADPAYKLWKDAALEQLTIFYKFRHEGSDVGMQDFVSNVVKNPLPDPASPLPPLPVTAPATAPSTSGASVGAAASGSSTSVTSAVAPAPNTGTVKPVAAGNATTAPVARPVTAGPAASSAGKVPE
jgi:hypothetical protein